MLRRAAARAAGALLPSRMVTSRTSSLSNVSTAVNSMILRSLKEHYFEVSKMTPPHKVSPPNPFTVVKGALDSGGPVLKRRYGEEEISISVMPMANYANDNDENSDDDDEINQLCLNVLVSKPGQKDALQFLCALYPDALGIHSLSMREKLENSGYLDGPTKYTGIFVDLDERMRDALLGYIEERGINHSLFPFLQVWLYMKEHRNLMRWFKSVGTFVNEPKQASVAQ